MQATNARCDVIGYHSHIFAPLRQYSGFSRVTQLAQIHCSIRGSASNMKDRGAMHPSGDELAQRLQVALQSFSIQEDESSKPKNPNNARTRKSRGVSAALAELKHTGTIEVANPEEAGNGDASKRPAIGKSCSYAKRGTTRAFPYAKKYPVDPDKIDVVKMLNVVSKSFQQSLDAEAAARIQVQAELDKLEADRAVEHALWECQMNSLKIHRDELTKQLAEATKESARKDEELKNIAKRMNPKIEEALQNKDRELKKVTGGGQGRLNYLVDEKDEAQTKAKEAQGSSFCARIIIDAHPPSGVATHKKTLEASRKGSKQARAA